MNKPKLTKPIIGGDVSIWGDKLNKNIDSQDVFNQELIEDSSRQDQELARLERDKISQNEINTVVKNTVDNYVDTTTKPQLAQHVDTVNKPELDKYTETKKSQIDTFTDEQKVELNTHEKEKEKEINTHVETKKSQIDTFTDEQKVELNTHEKEKEKEINTHVETKKSQIDTFTDEQKVELNTHEKEKEAQLESFKDEKKVEITNHTNLEIDRINATGIEVKQDKTDTALETENKTVVGSINELLVKVKNKTITVGNGLATTGISPSGQTISITPKNESLLVNDNSIWVNIVNDFTTGGVNKVASAESIKVLKQLIDTIGGGGATKLLRASEALGEYDYIGDLPSGGISITVGARLFNPTLYLDGVRFEENRYSVEFETGLITLNEPYANYNVVWVVEDQMPYHVTFCFPTRNLLLASEDIKSRIKLGNVIKILGASDEDDGGHYLVKCENTAKLNAVDIGDGRFLNEIPNTRISSIKAQVDQNKSDILSNNENRWREYISPDAIPDTQIGIDSVVEPGIYNCTAESGEYHLSQLDVKQIFPHHIRQILHKWDKGVRWREAYNSGFENIPWTYVFDTKNCPIIKGSNGWTKLANGFIIQWGNTIFENIQSGTQTEKIITLPISFTADTYSVITEISSAFSSDKVNSNHHTKSDSSFILRCVQTSGSTANSISVGWVAIGY